MLYQDVNILKVCSHSHLVADSKRSSGDPDFQIQNFWISSVVVKAALSRFTGYQLAISAIACVCVCVCCKALQDLAPQKQLIY